ncbi:MAG TPA: NUDIX domain-containing protein [Roseomonas sp.]|nr:NUDIX domain-containing protein [Roseomonas sp.]
MSSTALRVAHPRHAASLILWRQAPSGSVEVLMGVRAAGHRFMPNRLVFPGGRVDFADRFAPAASELRPETRAALERRAPPRLARALAMAAARELEEETGLQLGGPQPALDRLDYLCRAVTPRQLPIRFNARFLIAPEEATTGRLTGSGELESLAWVTPEAALRLPVAPITACVLAEFRDWLGLQAAARPARPLICLRGAGRRCPEPLGPGAAS